MHIIEKCFYYVAQSSLLPQLQEKIVLSLIFPTIIFSSKLAHGMHHPRADLKEGRSTPS